MRNFVFWFILPCAIVTVALFTGIAISTQGSWQKESQHVPKFAYGQCFAKAGLREPWDLDVAGRVYTRGYTKYLVMYASEANRVSGGVKDGWEEDIRSFDAKYQPVPCPEAWVKHTK